MKSPTPRTKLECQRVALLLVLGGGMMSLNVYEMILGKERESSGSY